MYTGKVQTNQLKRNTLRAQFLSQELRLPFLSEDIESFVAFQVLQLSYMQKEVHTFELSDQRMV